MGLFTKKTPCPICGGKISWFLPTKIEGEYICDKCSSKLDMEQEIQDGLTMQGFREYLAFYEQNRALAAGFVPSHKLDFGFLDTKVVFDAANRLFCMSAKLDKTIFEGAQLKSFTIKEDAAPLFAGSADGLVRYASTVPERLMSLAPQIQMMAAARRTAEAMERMRRDEDDHRPAYRPPMDIPEPFKQFNVELWMDHPYWNVIRCDMSGPIFSNDYPDPDSYLREYQENAGEMEQLALALMAVGFPGAGEVYAEPGMSMGVSAGAAIPRTAAPDRAADDILKYKSLLDAGVITQEEFDQKKKQLLGI